MKKFNKILMMSVAILLCMVLISTSVVSGVFAKFAIQKTTSTAMTLRAFGVDLTMSTADDAADLAACNANVGSEVADGKSGTISITGLQIAPGNDLSKAIKFTISGVPTVDMVIKITTTLTITTGHWDVPASTKISGTSTSAAEYFMPIGFTLAVNPTSADGNYILNPWYKASSSNFTKAKLENLIATGIGGTSGKITAPTPSVSDGTVTLSYPKSSTTSTPTVTIGGTATSSFYMGFAYPMTYDNASGLTSAQLDTIGTWLAAQGTIPTLTVAYTVTLEQA